MTHIENLKRGQWVAVLKYKGPFAMDRMGREREPEYDGVPLQVLSVSPPFVAVLWKGQPNSVDTRLFDLIPVNWRYAKAMLAAPGIKPKKKRREKPDPNLCPRCNTRFQRRIIVIEGQNAIHIFCPECDYDNGVLECVQ